MYHVQELWSDGTIALEATCDDPDSAFKLGEKLAQDPTFKADYVRVICEGELVWRTYWTVVLSFVDGCPTKWHPTDREGPFSVLTRGCFDSEREAREWAANHLDGHPFEIRQQF